MPVMYETYEGMSGIIQGDANETSPMASEYIKTYSVNPCVRSMKRDLLFSRFLKELILRNEVYSMQLKSYRGLFPQPIPPHLGPLPRWGEDVNLPRPLRERAGRGANVYHN